MAVLDEILESRTPESIREEAITKLTSENPIFNSVQEKGRTDMIFSVIADILSKFTEDQKILNDEQNILTAQSEITIENLALPFYSRKIAKGSQVPIRIRRNKDVIYNDSPDAPVKYFNENIFIKQSDICFTGGVDSIEFSPTNDDVLFADDDEIILRFDCNSVGLYTNIDANTIVGIESDYAEYVIVDNPSTAWGGCDEENIEDVKLSAINARYELEKATSTAIKEVMKGLGYAPKDYFLKEFIGGKYGSFGLYINTNNDDEIELLKYLLEAPIRAYGVGLIVGKVRKLDFNINVNVLVNSDSKLLFNEIKNIKNKVESLIRDYTIESGVGRRLSKPALEYFITDRTITQYAISKTDITFSGIEERITNDEILLRADELLNVNSIIINVNENVIDNEEDLMI